MQDTAIEAQEEDRGEVLQARELRSVPGVGLEDLDLNLINDYIQQLNCPVRTEPLKPDLESSRPFPERQRFFKDDQVTTLGMLICGHYPEDQLGCRCHAHDYVDVPQVMTRDKQDLAGTVPTLMQDSLSYVLRNIQVGVSIKQGGQAVLQSPELALREAITNALAHREYSINKQAIISIRPGTHISIRNPGQFRKSLLIDSPGDPLPVRRIIPEARARNPKLADVLRVFRKWERKGIGMATLANLALGNQIDLPTYRLYTEEVCLFLNAGPLLGERMKTHLQGFEPFIEEKLGAPLTTEQALVLCYLIKLEWANRRYHFTILLTPDNNHFEQLLLLEHSGLIVKHERSRSLYPIYVPHRVLMQKDYREELRSLFGEALTGLDPLSRDCLQIVFRYEHYSRARSTTAKHAAFALWHATKGGYQDIREFDRLFRRVRRAFNSLESLGFILRAEGKGYRLNRDYSSERLL